jgi:hypothetical protein
VFQAYGVCALTVAYEARGADEVSVFYPHGYQGIGGIVTGYSEIIVGDVQFAAVCTGIGIDGVDVAAEIDFIVLAVGMQQHVERLVDSFYFRSASGHDISVPTNGELSANRASNTGSPVSGISSLSSRLQAMVFITSPISFRFFFPALQNGIRADAPGT